MAFLQYHDYSHSPTIFAPPHQHSFNHMSCSQSFKPSPSSQPVRSLRSPATSNTSAITNLSRKRSRADDDEPFDAPSSAFFEVSTPPLPKLKPEPVYGEGMTLIDPSNGLTISAESQTGTWYEEQLEVERLAAAQAADLTARHQTDDPTLPRCKFQRRSPSSDAGACEQSILSSHTQGLASLHDEPALDSISHSFGEWACVSEDQLMRSASRGWAKFVERYHRSLNNVEVLLRFKARDQCLIRANEGFFLFKDDLTEGQLVAQTWERAVANLKAEPPIFEGTELLRAERSPAPSEHSGYRAQRSESSLPDTDSSAGSGMDID